MTNKDRHIGLAVFLGITAVLLIVQFLYYHPSWIGEQAATANYWHKTVGLITDMPHATAELFYSMVDNLITWIVLLPIGRMYLKRRDARVHAQLDAEHGYEHDEDGTVRKI